MIRIYGVSDDLVEIEGSAYSEDEIGCYDKDVRIWFVDGTVIRIGYCKPGVGVWYIVVEETGTAGSLLTICNDEDADIYSDIYEIDAEILRHEVIKQVGIQNG